MYSYKWTNVIGYYSGVQGWGRAGIWRSCRKRRSCRIWILKNFRENSSKKKSSVFFWEIGKNIFSKTKKFKSGLQTDGIPLWDDSCQFLGPAELGARLQPEGCEKSPSLVEFGWFTKEIKQIPQNGTSWESVLDNFEQLAPFGLGSRSELRWT